MVFMEQSQLDSKMGLLAYCVNPSCSSVSLVDVWTLQSLICADQNPLVTNLSLCPLEQYI